MLALVAAMVGKHYFSHPPELVAAFVDATLDWLGRLTLRPRPTRPLPKLSKRLAHSMQLNSMSANALTAATIYKIEDTQDQLVPLLRIALPAALTLLFLPSLFIGSIWAGDDVSGARQSDLLSRLGDACFRSSPSPLARSRPFPAHLASPFPLTVKTRAPPISPARRSSGPWATRRASFP